MVIAHRLARIEKALERREAGHHAAPPRIIDEPLAQLTLRKATNCNPSTFTKSREDLIRCARTEKAPKCVGSKQDTPSTMETGLLSSASAGGTNTDPALAGTSSSSITWRAPRLSRHTLPAITWLTSHHPVADAKGLPASITLHAPPQEPTAPEFPKLRFAFPSARQWTDAASQACDKGGRLVAAKALAVRCECQMRSPC